MVLATLFFLSSCLSNLNYRHTRPATKVSIQKKTQVPLIRKRISLLTFYNETPIGGAKLGVVAVEEFKKELEKRKEFVVILKNKGSMALSSKHIYSTGGAQLSTLSWKDKLSGIHFILYGRITKAKWKEEYDDIGFFRKKNYQANVRLEIRVFDISSNRNVFSQTFSGKATSGGYKFYKEDKKQSSSSYRNYLLKKAIQGAIRRSIPHLALSSHEVDWTGRIAKIIGPKIYLSAGKKSGVKLGDIMNVVTEGTEIYDPETGALIGISRGDVKGTLEVIDFFGEDGAIAILHSGGSVVEGDFVQLYQ